jgi:hypothetical protein
MSYTANVSHLGRGGGYEGRKLWDYAIVSKVESRVYIFHAYEVSSSMIRTMNSALFLLHHLIYSPTYTPHLAQRLYNASATRVYNGITHMFILCMGRISYADPPDWLGKDAAVGIERITGEEILFLVPCFC